jgi:hypothetical protein
MARKIALPTSRGPAVLAAIGMALAFPGSVVTFTQQPVFRSTVDVIAVDVQVVDRDGNPIGEIGPDAFQVSINGQKRKVVSAQFVRPAQVSAALLAADATKAVGRPTTWLIEK